MRYLKNNTELLYILLILTTVMGFMSFMACSTPKGTVTKALMGKQDAYLEGSGSTTTHTFTRTTQTGYNITLNKFDWVGIDVLMVYGGGVNKNSATLNSAITDWGTTQPVKFYIAPGTWSITANVTFPKNIVCVIDPLATLSISSGIVATFNSPENIVAGIYQKLKTGSGTIEFTTPGTIHVGWFLTSGQPDGSTSNTTEVQEAITAFPSAGGTLIMPKTASAYKINITVPANVTIQGDVVHNTVVGPATNSSPVMTITGSRPVIRNFYFLGAGSSSLYAIRSARSTDGAAGGALIEQCRFDEFLDAVYINNNYYNEIRNCKFEDIRSGVSGHNAFNRNSIHDNKFSSFDYGVAICNFTDDTYTSHGNSLYSNAFESPNTGGIGLYYLNCGGNKSDDYFEGFNSASGWAVLEGGGPVFGWHNGAGNEAFLVDKWGRDFEKLGVRTGVTVYNKTDGSEGLVTSIADSAATNDRLNMVLVNGTCDVWDDDDYFLIDIDTQTEFSGGNVFINPIFTSQADANTFLRGYNHITSNVIGKWCYKENGALKYNKTSSSGIVANTRTVIDLSSNLTGWSGYFLGKAIIAYRVQEASGSACYFTLRPRNGGANEQMVYVNVPASGDVSGNLLIDLDADATFEYMASSGTTLTIRIHQLLTN